jgi:tRNA dimethylallyltransferase
MKNKENKKIIVILGPTASGKTKLAVRLARKFNGEIVSADSRQVYKGMDVGTGKDLINYQTKKIKKIINIPHHLIDVVSPKTEFDLAKYQRLAYKAINDIVKRGKVPILAGGSGLYLQAVVDGYVLPVSRPDRKLREKLEKLTVENLFLTLKKLDYKKAESLNESDRKNKRRLVRYIEIAESPKNSAKPDQKTPRQNYKFLLIGLKVEKNKLQKRIYKRLLERLENENMIGEVKRLRKNGLSWKRLENFGLEYKFISLYLQGKLDYEEMVEKLNIAIGQFAKRQMSWFRRWERQGREIYWVKNGETAKLVGKFIK